MNLSWMSVFVFFLAIPWQVNNEKVCDHAAPPPGMRWQCSETNKCDCRLVPRAGGNGLDEEGRAGRAEPAPYLACRLLYFVLPEYPEAARKAQKQGTVSAILILNGAGEVSEVRVQSGDPALASVVQAAGKQWRFTASHREESIPISVTFELSDQPAGAVSGRSLLNPVIVARPMR
jgi:TonB family protein